MESFANEGAHGFRGSPVRLFWSSQKGGGVASSHGQTGTADGGGVAWSQGQTVTDGGGDAWSQGQMGTAFGDVAPNQGQTGTATGAEGGGDDDDLMGIPPPTKTEYTPCVTCQANGVHCLAAWQCQFSKCQACCRAAHGAACPRHNSSYASFLRAQTRFMRAQRVRGGGNNMWWFNAATGSWVWGW